MRRPMNIIFDEKVEITTFEDLDAEEILNEFKSAGYNVTEEALRHNFEAWKQDFKSGYLDEKNGYFLFSPCGCNPLKFHVEETDGKSYQKTYIC